jgi:hypothetical protein
MPIVTLPSRPRSLPTASPRLCDEALLHKLIADRPSLVAWAKALEPRCLMIQRRCTSGHWQSERELRQMQRQAVTVLRAAHAHRDLDGDALVALDGLMAFTAGVDMIAGRAA